MKGNALVYQITIPFILVAGAASVVLFEWSLTTALITYVISTAVPLFYGVKRAWKHFGDLFTDPDLPAVTDLSALLGYSIPMAFSGRISTQRLDGSTHARMAHSEQF